MIALPPTALRVALAGAIRSAAVVALVAGCAADSQHGSGGSDRAWTIDAEVSSFRLRTGSSGEEILCSLPWLPADLVVDDATGVAAVLRADVSGLTCDPSWATEFLASPLLFDASNKPELILSFRSAEEKDSTIPVTVEVCGARQIVPLLVSARRTDPHTVRIEGEAELEREWFGMTFETYPGPEGREVALDPRFVIGFTVLACAERSGGRTGTRAAAVADSTAFPCS